MNSNAQDNQFVEVGLDVLEEIEGGGIGHCKPQSLSEWVFLAASPGGYALVCLIAHV